MLGTKPRSFAETSALSVQPFLQPKSIECIKYTRKQNDPPKQQQQ